MGPEFFIKLERFLIIIIAVFKILCSIDYMIKNVTKGQFLHRHRSHKPNSFITLHYPTVETRTASAHSNSASCLLCTWQLVFVAYDYSQLPHDYPRLPTKTAHLPHDYHNSLQAHLKTNIYLPFLLLQNHEKHVSTKNMYNIIIRRYTGGAGKRRLVSK